MVFDPCPSRKTQMNEATHHKPLFHDHHSLGNQYGSCCCIGPSSHTISNILLNRIFHVWYSLVSICLILGNHKTAADLFAVMRQKPRQCFHNHKDTTSVALSSACRPTRSQVVAQNVARKYRLALAYLIPIMLIVPLCGCATSTRPLPTDPKPLAIASCPKLTKLSDDSFGAVTSKLIEVSEIYYTCRASVGIKE